MTALVGFWFRWLLTAISFPIGGGLAFALTGSVTVASTGAVAGLVVGLIVGAAQWFALRPAISITPWWIAASAAGLSGGLALATGVLGVRTDPLSLAMRGALTGAAVGALQWVLLRQHVSMAGWWILVVAACWALGWLVTRAVGVDLSRGWPVFGISGAAVFAALTGLGLMWLLRHPTP